MHSVMRNVTLIAAVILAPATTAIAQGAYESPEFPFVPEEAGWVDQDAGLVWGVEISTLNPYILSWSWGAAGSAAEGYAWTLWNAGQEAIADANSYQAQADAYDAAGDVAARDFYQALADEQYAEADANYAAADAASQHTGWRLPTLQEVQAAHAKGLFTFARNTQLIPGDPDRIDVRRWTSTGQGKKIYVFYPSNGTVDLIETSYKFAGQTYYTFGLPMVVRSLNPDTGDGGGPGNGKGKNK